MQWYELNSEKMHHNDIHKKHFKRNSNLRLETDNVIPEGLGDYASFLELQVGHIICNRGIKHMVSRDIMTQC